MLARCLAGMFNPILYPGSKPHLPVSQEEIAQLAGLSRQRANQALQRLEQAGLLAGRWVTAESGRRRRVYAITRRGKRELDERRTIWEQFSDAVGSLFKGSRSWQNPA